MSHSIIPPSSAGIWGKSNGCTGWVEMTRQYPQLETDPEALQGEASHQIGEMLIQQYRLAQSISVDKFTGTTAENGEIFTEEMYDGAKIYADDVQQVMRETSVFAEPYLGIEKRLTMPGIHEQSFGTPDCYLFDKVKGDLYLWDYKFGHGVVEAYENWQLINYVAGLLTLIDPENLYDSYITVHMRIIQPRAHHPDGIIREWKTTLFNLRGYFNILTHNAQEALSDQAVTRTGSHCRYCTARHACPPALSAGLLMYEMVDKPVPVELSPQALGVQLTIIKRALKQLEYLESGLDEQVKSLIRSGTLVPGFKTQMGHGREKWKMPTAEVIAMGDMCGVDVRKPDDLITPNQARKLGIDEAVIKAYSETPSTGLKIVPDNGNKAKQVFEND